MNYEGKLSDINEICERLGIVLSHLKINKGRSIDSIRGCCVRSSPIIFECRDPVSPFLN
jgi:hypothetical protein